jgi:hypothetical protein
MVRADIAIHEDWCIKGTVGVSMMDSHFYLGGCATNVGAQPVG